MSRLNLPLSIVRLRDAGEVAQARLCVGCGACVYACGDDRVSLINRLDEGLRPVIATGDCGDCHDCVDVCPGVGIAHRPGGDRVDGAAHINALTESWGPVLEVWEGHASDAPLRADGSSGGLASALALHCIEQLGMHGLLHIAADESARWVNRSVLSRDRSAILAATGSRYAPASPCDKLKAIEDAPGRCVFVGKPCDVQALRKAQALRPGLDARVGVAIGIFCAGTPSQQGTLDLLAMHGVDPAQVDELRYRGRGWPGSFAVRMKGSATWRELASYADAWGFLQRYRPYRCHLCPDGTSEFADIACGDPWYREIAADEPGRSLVVVRTDRGREIVRSAIAAGCVQLEAVDPAVLALSQHELQRKRGAIWGRLLTMTALGVAAPRFDGFSLYRNWLQIAPRERFRSVAGTARRVLMRGYHLRRRDSPLRQREGEGEPLIRRWLRRAYVRALRQLGMKELSWDKQFEPVASIYGPRSEHMLGRVIALCRGGRLIEFGCGEGDTAFALPAGAFASYVGYDVSSVAIGRATQRALSRGVARVTFEQGDMAKWDRPERADLILAEECLYYLSARELERFLERCMRSLADDGSMLVIVHSAAKHATTLDVCRRVCAVRDESLIGSRTFMTLVPRAR